MKGVTLHEAAEAELREALDYHDRQRAGLGSELRREFESAFNKVRANPLSYAVQDAAGVRHAPLRRFPCMLVFVDLNDQLWVVAVAHHKRRPRYRSSRRTA